MQALPTSARPRSPSVWRMPPIGRSLLPVVAMMLLAAATAFSAWLLLFAVDFGFRLFTQGG